MWLALFSFPAITVAVDDSLKSVRLPDNSVKVFGSSWPSDPAYHYKWIKLSGPAAGDLVKQDKVLELKNVRCLWSHVQYVCYVLFVIFPLYSWLRVFIYSSFWCTMIPVTMATRLLTSLFYQVS